MLWKGQNLRTFSHNAQKGRNLFIASFFDCYAHSLFSSVTFLFVCCFSYLLYFCFYLFLCFCLGATRDSIQVLLQQAWETKWNNGNWIHVSLLQGYPLCCSSGPPFSQFFWPSSTFPQEMLISSCFSFSDRHIKLLSEKLLTHPCAPLSALTPTLLEV